MKGLQNLLGKGSVDTAKDPLLSHYESCGHSQGRLEQKPRKNFGKSSHSQGVPKFSGHPYIRHIVWSSVRQHSFLVWIN